MQLIPDQMPPGRVYSTMIRAITPRPIAWVSTLSAGGVLNLAPFSYFCGVCSQPACLAFSPVTRPDGTEKDTLVNIRETGEFVVNVVSHAVAEKMSLTSGEYPPEVDEFQVAKLTPVESTQVRPPRVAESPIHFECVTHNIVPVGSGPYAAHLVIGRILVMHIDDNVLDEAGKIDPQRVDAIGRMGGLAYSLTRDRFELDRPQVPTEK